MKKKVLSVLLVAAMTATMFAGCGNETTEAPADLSQFGQLRMFRSLPSSWQISSSLTTDLITQ